MASDFSTICADITVLTMAKCESEAELLATAETLWKFHLRSQYRRRLRHLVIVAAATELIAKLEVALLPLMSVASLELTLSKGSFRDDFNWLFSQVQTPFALLFLSDHVLESHGEDFLSTCVHALKLNVDIYQIHLSGPYCEWSVQASLRADIGFQEYLRSCNPFAVPFYPWFRVSDDELWWGGRLLWTRRMPGPGNGLRRRVVVENEATLWVSPPIGEKSHTQSHVSFSMGGGFKHLAFGFNGAPCLYNMDIFNKYLPIPAEVVGCAAEIGELYFYRQTDIDARYATAWLNAQTFFWHDDYGWGLRSEAERALFREIMLRKQL